MAAIVFCGDRFNAAFSIRLLPLPTIHLGLRLTEHGREQTPILARLGTSGLWQVSSSAGRPAHRVSRSTNPHITLKDSDVAFPAEPSLVPITSRTRTHLPAQPFSHETNYHNQHR